MTEISIAASSIAAQAFRFMELSPPSSFQDSSPQAAAALEQYPLARDLCLEYYDWSFARKHATLAPIAAASIEYVDPLLAGQFSAPSDMIKIRSVVPEDISWRIDARRIFADVIDSLTIRYTFRIENEAVLPAVFQTAVSYELANRLAPFYVSSRTKRAQIQSNGVDALEMAKKFDGHTASEKRYDGHDYFVDWVAEATR
ncbi:hypothetical protein KX928_23340 [Roseobacter sp. YSTF-M11]|uniref:Uncharacterized protein n=1 Tax=Roseobacter insulae TaxID=2859783 RepID=A0A9X1FYV9_9RHOB|nr:hypothetical protein [Roseobacter insulae]MBW4710735.1 hypothetical protein [Roseobacter insulae]